MKITIPHDELEVLARASLIGRGFTPEQAARFSAKVSCNHRVSPPRISLVLEDAPIRHPELVEGSLRGPVVAIATLADGSKRELYGQ